MIMDTKVTRHSIKTLEGSIVLSEVTTMEDWLQQANLLATKVKQKK